MRHFHYVIHFNTVLSVKWLRSIPSPIEELIININMTTGLKSEKKPPYNGLDYQEETVRDHIHPRRIWPGRIESVTRTAHLEPGSIRPITICCGLRKVRVDQPRIGQGPALQSRIVHGIDAEMNEYPWIARLVLRLPNGQLKMCGGSVIASQWILTAHHCLRSIIDPNRITVTLGDHVISSKGESNMEKEFRVSKIINHGDSLDMAVDISLLKLIQPVSLSTYTPICLPEHTTENDYMGKNAWIYGWGAKKFGEAASDVLQKAKLEIVSNTECDKAFKEKQYSIDIVRSQICAGTKGHGVIKDSCQGDSGGPLSYNRGGIHEQVGIVSQGVDCASIGLYGIYAYVGFLKDWIENTVESNGGGSLPTRC